MSTQLLTGLLLLSHISACHPYIPSSLELTNGLQGPLIQRWHGRYYMCLSRSLVVVVSVYIMLKTFLWSHWVSYSTYFMNVILPCHWRYIFCKNHLQQPPFCLWNSYLQPFLKFNYMAFLRHFFSPQGGNLDIVFAQWDLLHRAIETCLFGEFVNIPINPVGCLHFFKLNNEEQLICNNDIKL